MTVDEGLLRIFRAEAGERLDAMVERLLAVERGEGGADAVDELLRHAHSLKGTAAMVGFEGVAMLASGVEEVLVGGRSAGVLDPLVTPALLDGVDAMRAVVWGREVDLASVTAALEVGAAEAAARPAARPTPAPAADAPLPSPVAAPPSMRVPAWRVDQLLDAAGEAVLYHRRLEHLLGGGEGDERLREELEHGETLLGELHHGVLELRTFPLSTIVGPFPRAVRDAAAGAGREVELELEGVDTQLDRAILTGLGDAIVHLLRNAVAHGIEPPDVREARGKPRRGRIVVRAETEGAAVIVSVIDDGGGIDADLLAQADSPVELVALMTRPGFSTAAEVDALAGRGVGLDSVQRDLRSLGGTLLASSEPGHGSTFSVRLPATLAVLPVLIVGRSGQRLGLPMASVEELLLDVPADAESVRVRGHDVELADLMTLLAGKARPARNDGPVAALLVLGRRLAVRCDAIEGDQEAVIKPLGALLANVPGYLGATVLDDGAPALIVDPRHLIRMAADAPRAVAIAPPVVPAPTRPHRVLVVDDQVTVRELERRILNAAGYEVLLAGDGREALDVIARDGGIDLVLSDVEMPRLDGLELVEALRADPKRSGMPVVLISSRGGRDDMRRGAAAGADAYVAKASFDERALLDTVARLVAR